jgi:arsenate reductase
MAEAILRHVSQERGIEVVSSSAGTMGAGDLNPICVVALQEIGVSVEGQYPKVLSPELSKGASNVISMGCGVDAEACPTKFILTEDWGLDDPNGQPIEVVRTIRDQIRARVAALVDNLDVGKA